MDDPHVVEILHRIQNLVDELAGVSLRVEALLHDPVKQLAAGHAAKEGRDMESGKIASQLFFFFFMSSRGVINFRR